MKTLLIITIVISLNCVMAEEISFILPNLTIDNIIIQNGSTPYLHFEYIEERRTPEVNLVEELETQLIAIDLLRRCI